MTNAQGDVFSTTSKKENIEEALSEILDKCEEEDETGYFFELEDADVAEFEKNPAFHKVGDYGTICEVVREKENLVDSPELAGSPEEILDER